MPKSLDSETVAKSTHHGPSRAVARAESRAGTVEWELRRRIEDRTNGRIAELKVESMGGRVIVSGHVDRYYLLQLAFAAVREISASEEVELRIAVASTAGDGSRTSYRLAARET